eukprot:TRINITY_DN6388_c0_g1_i2.p1 TRINITY_DN6388_c0_g1~~TRINITY_DN6388_c0_g1_i2.p1  ORF type:complete len:504 (-),score=66.28 TRINITY_DN6388_c0_g1_i2:155-1666(-)
MEPEKQDGGKVHAYRLHTMRPRTNESATLNQNKPLHEATVVLVGAQGHGKSTFANYLLNYGIEEIFKTSTSMTACTKEVKKVALEYETPQKRVRLTIVDTPGLNDEDDFQQMREVLTVLSALESVSAVILCMNHRQRNDINFQATISYYRQLLKPIFDQKSIILVCTQIDNDSYLDLKERNALPAWVDERKANFRAEKVDVDFVELVNSKPRSSALMDMKEYLSSSEPKQIERLRTLYASVRGRGDAPQSILPPPPEHLAIHLASRDSRKRILSLVASFIPTSLRNHHFPLPPSIARTRLLHLSHYVATRENLMMALESEKKFMERLHTDLRGVEKELRDILDEVANLNNALEGFMARRKSPPFTKAGNEFFFFGRLKGEVLSVPTRNPNFKVHVITHNCKVEETKRKTAQNATYVEYDIIPDFFNFTKDARLKDARWAFTAYAEWEGLDEPGNKEKIEGVTRELERLGGEKRKVEGRMKELKGTWIVVRWRCGGRGWGSCRM